MSALTEHLVSYLPRLIIRRVAADPAPVTEATGDSFPAAVMLADISGFTMLTERLVARGPAGIEDLTAILNAYFGQIVNLVVAHGGDIVKFAGDALLAVWPIGDADPAAATVRATQCSLNIQRTLDGFAAPEGVQLSLKIAITTGEVSVMHLGGVYNRWEVLVAGRSMIDVGLIIKHAEPGQVVLGGDVLALMGDRCALRYTDTQIAVVEQVYAPAENVVEELPPLSDECESALMKYLPAAIRSRITMGQTGWLGELRRLTVLFINLPDLTSNTPVNRSQEAMLALQQALYHYEGSINKLSIDEKGVSLIAALGLPPLAHENDPARGVLAAMAMKAGLKELGLRSSIGIATGKVFCGVMGSRLRQEYTVMGDVVNLAARLMQATDGGILSDEATYQGAQQIVQMDKLSAIYVKGRHDPVPIYRPLAVVRTPVRPQLEMVGRAVERSQLSAEFTALKQGGPGGLVILEGEAGIGKSRLVAHAMDEAVKQDLTLLVGAGDAVERSTSFYAWRSIFEALLHIQDAGQDPEQVAAHVQSYFPPDPDLPNLIPLLRAVLPVDLPDNAVTAEMGAQARGDNTRYLLLRVLQESARLKPMVLILDDAQWMDSASWSLAQLVSQRVQPLLLLISTRPIQAPIVPPPEYVQFAQSPEVKWLRLDSLTPEESVALACRRLGVDSLPDQVTQLIREKAGGHPFFSEEIAFALRDTGTIQIDDGKCTLSPGVEDLWQISFPDTVHGVVTSRIDRLPPPQQMTLKVASVIGRIFAIRTLQEVYPIESDRENIGQYLTHLATLDLTPLESPAPELSYLFKHIVTQEVAYNLMLFQQRRDLHRAIAQWVEQSHAGNLEPFYPFLAHHWERAEEPERAVDYLERAGESALTNGSNQEAIRLLGQAAELTQNRIAPVTALRRARWQRWMGQAYMNLGQLTIAKQHMEQALALLERPIPRHIAGLVGSVALQFVRQVGHRLAPALLVGRTRAADQTRSEAALTHALLVELCFYTRDSLGSFHSALQILNLGEQDGPTPELAQAYVSGCFIAAFFPLPPLCEYYSRRALAVAEEVGQLYTLGKTTLGLSAYYTGNADWDRALELNRRSFEYYDRMNDRRGWGQSAGVRGWIAWVRCEYELHRTLTERSFATAQETGDLLLHAWGLCGQGIHYLRFGRVAEAAKCFDAALPVLRQNSDFITLTYALAGLGLARLRQGDRQEARRLGEESLTEILRAPAGVFASLEGHVVSARLFLELWETAGPDSPDRQRMARLARKACRALRAFARVFPIGRPAALVCNGKEAALLGRVRRSRQQWRKAADLANALGMSYEEALACYELGRAGGREEARPWLARASMLFEKVGVPRESEQTALALRQLDDQ